MDSSTWNQECTDCSQILATSIFFAEECYENNYHLLVRVVLQMLLPVKAIWCHIPAGKGYPAYASASEGHSMPHSATFRRFLGNIEASCLNGKWPARPITFLVHQMSLLQHRCTLYCAAAGTYGLVAPKDICNILPLQASLLSESECKTTGDHSLTVTLGCQQKAPPNFWVFSVSSMSTVSSTDQLMDTGPLLNSLQLGKDHMGRTQIGFWTW